MEKGVPQMNPATKKEWLASLRDEPMKHDRMVYVPRIIVILLLGFFLAAAIHKAYAEPRYALQGQGVTVTLTDEKCALDAVTNLPYRATWTENGQTFEGCWSISFDEQRVNVYFGNDKTVVSFPPSMFSKVTGV
jgi:hypothetical protein